MIQLLGEKMHVEETGIITWMSAFTADTRPECYGAIDNPYGDPFVENIWKRQARQRESANGYIIDATFEGLITGVGIKWGIYPSFREAKLPTHPRFFDILDKYGGQYDPTTGIIVWNRSPSSANSGGGFSGAASGPGFALGFSSSLSGDSGGGSGSGQDNPLFGQDSYVQVAAVFRMTTITTEIDPEALSRIGGIIGSLPVAMPTPAGRNWLVMPAPFEKRSPFLYEDTYEALLSPPGKPWNEDVQELIQT